MCPDEAGKKNYTLMSLFKANKAYINILNFV